MATADVIKFDGFQNKADWIAYKYPGQEFLWGSQLIVGPGQEAVFIKDGQICDVMGPGSHTLHTGSLPILRKLVRVPFGGKAPFTAEIYFVNRAAKLDMHWGTATPFQLEDAKYGIIVSIRAHGKYGVRISNAGLFVGELVGAAPADTMFDHSFVSTYFNSILMAHIKSNISAFMINRQISFLDVTAHLMDLSHACNDSVATEFERFGIEIVNLSIETISPPASDFEQLKKMKEKYAMGEHVYTQERKLDMLDKLVSNPSNAAVNTGAGLGVGVMAAKEMMGMFQEYTAEPAAAPAAPVAPTTPVAPAAPAGTIPCPNCGNPVPAQQKFCGECGAKMEKTCPNCGTVWGPTQKFCGECGTKL